MNGYLLSRGLALEPGAASWTYDTNELAMNCFSEVYTMCTRP
jgi:hypothetical protein